MVLLVLLCCVVLTVGAPIDKIYEKVNDGNLIAACTREAFNEYYQPPASCREAFYQYKEAAANLTDLTPSLNTICNSTECHNPVIHYYRCLGFQDYGKKLCMKEGNQYCQQIGIDYTTTCIYRDCGTTDMLNTSCNPACRICMASYYRESGCCTARYSELDYYSDTDLTRCGIAYKQCRSSGHTSTSTDPDEVTTIMITVIQLNPSTCTVFFVLIACIICLTILTVRTCHC